MPPALPEHVSSFHNALVEERPLGMRSALATGVHPMDRNTDGKNVWEVLLSNSASPLRVEGGVAHDVRQILVGLASMPARSPEEALEMVALEKRAIQTKHEGVRSTGMDFVHDCLGLAVQSIDTQGMPLAQAHQILNARAANQALARQLEAQGAPSIQLSGNTVSVPLQVGPPSLHQGEASGRAPGDSPEDPESLARWHAEITGLPRPAATTPHSPSFLSLQERRALKQGESDVSSAPQPGRFKP